MLHFRLSAHHLQTLHHKLFDISPRKYRELWWEAGEKLEIKNLKPPHTLRHTAASRDAFHKVRTLAELKDRGRWASDTSVARYKKESDYLAAMAAETDEMRDAARHVVKDWPTGSYCF